MTSPQTVSEFAQRVLLGTSLEEKLAPAPSSLILDPPKRGNFTAPDLPGRPDHLKPRSNGGKSPFPSAEQIEDDEQRGILLHFFANHELLAVELMALALLKFPDAPDAFRKGVLRTLQEEQNHTRWYLARMASCGLSLGDHHLSPMIWSHLSSMESPLDYISRLSLTFEQANLDYARHYAEVLARAGDQASADLLTRIYHDEIAHVGYGLKWLRRWKQDAQSDWEAWHRQLHFPLSPIRAKGLAPFNEEGRRKAGFKNDFITALKHFQASRGRSPDLYWFNPEAEMTAAQPGKKGPRRLEEMAADLEPAFALAAPARDDLVLLRRHPEPAHLEALARHGLTIPESAPLSDLDVIRRERKIRREIPWAKPDPDLLSKEMGLRLRSRVDPEGIPAAICQTSAEISSFIADHPWEEWLAKPLLGSAGRGLRPFSRDDLPSLRKPHLIEPRLRPILEFSLLYQAHPPGQGGLRFLGLCRQKVSAGGQWISSTSAPKPASGLPSGQAQLIANTILPAAKTKILSALAELLDEKSYFGPVGLDSFLHQGPRGLAWHLISEVNARWSMGRLAHQLRLKLAPNRPLTLTTMPKGATLPENALALGDPNTSHTRIPVAVLS